MTNSDRPQLSPAKTVEQRNNLLLDGTPIAPLHYGSTTTKLESIEFLNRHDRWYGGFFDRTDIYAQYRYLNTPVSTQVNGSLNGNNITGNISGNLGSSIVEVGTRFNF